MSDRTLRVLLADDHPRFREGLRFLVDSAADITVVGEAATGGDAVAQAHENHPDVVLMDLNMPILGGGGGGRGHPADRRTAPRDAHRSAHDVRGGRIGVRRDARRGPGLLLKGSGRDEVLRAIRTVAAGEAIFGPAIAERLTSYFASAADGAPRPFPELTARERDVLELIARGAGNGEIASQLDVSLKTVRNHVSNVFTKLRVMTRAQAIVKARDVGMGSEAGAD